jgi:hypothetical protein
VTDGGGLNAAVNTGGAIDYGFFYESDAAVNVACPNNSTVKVVARCSWAAQTVRLTQVAALVQNPGVTYDIPLAEVTTVAGAITLITDEREYCEFPTELLPDIVTASAIVDGSVTAAKLENQTRHFELGAGQMEPDATNPATFVYNGGSPYHPYQSSWQFSDAVTDTVWVTFRVPADFSGTDLDLYLWTRKIHLTTTGDVRWVASSWDAQPSAVLANQSITQDVSYSTAADYGTFHRDLIGTLTLAAGDIVTVEIYRDGGHANDTLATDIYLVAAEFEYTADS